MIGMFKRVTIAGIVLSLSAVAMGDSMDENYGLAWYSNAVQDVVSFMEYDEADLAPVDLLAQNTTPSPGPNFRVSLTLNEEDTSMAQLEERLRQSDSIVLNTCDQGKTVGFSHRIVELLKLIGDLDVSDNLINLNLECLYRTESASCDIVRILPDGSLLLGAAPVELPDLAERLRAGSEVGIETDSMQPPPPFSRILAVVNAIGDHSIHHIFCADRRMVQVKSRIVRLGENGREDTYSNASVTTHPGYDAVIRVVENRSGYKNMWFHDDPFEQEDLANNGICMKVKAQLFGHYIRLAGTIILRESDRRKESFKAEDMPIYSYSVAKSVIPFSVVLPPGTGGVEFPIAPIEGNRAVCRISASLVDEKGLSPEEREETRTAGAAVE